MRRGPKDNEVSREEEEELNRQNLGNTDDGKVTREEEEEMRRIQHQDEPQAY